MTFDRVWLRVALVAACIGAVPTLSHAGGVGFGEDDANSGDDGPSYFGFVREVDGPGVADAKVTAALKDRGALVTRTDIMGVYKIPGLRQGHQSRRRRHHLRQRRLRPGERAAPSARRQRHQGSGRGRVLPQTQVKHLLFAAAVVALACCQAGAGRAQTLTGSVTSAEEGAMEGVLVSAQAAGSPITVTVVSDEHGRFRFPDATPRARPLRAAHSRHRLRARRAAGGRSRRRDDRSRAQAAQDVRSCGATDQ